MHGKLVRVIAGLQVLGGALGLWLTSSTALAALPRVGMAVMLGALGIPFLLSIEAGRRLWRRDRSGLGLSLAVQGLQVMSFSTTQFVYALVIGLQVTQWMPARGVENDLHIWIGSAFDIARIGASQPLGIGINFVALFAFVYLGRKALQLRAAQAQIARAPA
jgi:hypothetical protein